jgi:phosphotransferase system HPr-like phosphotransfer protein
MKKHIKAYTERCKTKARALQIRLRPTILRSYLEIPEVVEVEETDGRSRAFIQDAIVGLCNEDYRDLPWGFMQKECLSYTKSEVIIAAPRGNGFEGSGKHLIDLQRLALFRGNLVDIAVVGPKSEEVKIQALRIYAGITTLADLPDFERLDPYINAEACDSRYPLCGAE